MSKSNKSGQNKPPSHIEADEPRSLEDEIDRQIGDLVPQGARGEVVRRVSTTLRAEFFSGPIAHPRHLREYEDICPGAADRIISMAENQNNHLMALEQRALQAEISDQRLGMVLGALAFFALLGAAAATALISNSLTLPGLFLGAAALGVIGKFINGRKSGGVKKD